MAQEAMLLRKHDRARVAVKSVVEMPGRDADRIVRSLKQANRSVSNKLRKEFPDLFEQGRRLFERSGQLVAAVREAFEGDEAHNGD